MNINCFYALTYKVSECNICLIQLLPHSILCSVNLPRRMMRHRKSELWIDEAINSDLFVKESSFKMVPGLSGTGISFQSITYPDRYVWHQNFKLYLHKNGNSYLFKQDATFTSHPGFEGSSVSFESVDFRGRFARASNFRVILSTDDGSVQFKKDASWKHFNKLNYF